MDFIGNGPKTCASNSSGSLRLRSLRRFSVPVDFDLERPKVPDGVFPDIKRSVRIYRAVADGGSVVNIKKSRPTAAAGFDAKFSEKNTPGCISFGKSWKFQEEPRRRRRPDGNSTPTEKTSAVVHLPARIRRIRGGARRPRPPLSTLRRRAASRAITTISYNWILAPPRVFVGRVFAGTDETLAGARSLRPRRTPYSYLYLFLVLSASLKRIREAVNFSVNSLSFHIGRTRLRRVRRGTRRNGNPYGYRVFYFKAIAAVVVVIIHGFFAFAAASLDNTRRKRVDRTSIGTEHRPSQVRLETGEICGGPFRTWFNETVYARTNGLREG